MNLQDIQHMQSFIQMIDDDRDKIVERRYKGKRCKSTATENDPTPTKLTMNNTLLPTQTPNTISKLSSIKCWICLKKKAVDDFSIGRETLIPASSKFNKHTEEYDTEYMRIPQPICQGCLDKILLLIKDSRR